MRWQMWQRLKALAKSHRRPVTQEILLALEAHLAKNQTAPLP